MYKKHNLCYLNTVSPRASFSLGFWKGKGFFAFVLGRYGPRVELYFANDANKLLFDSMFKYKDEINKRFEASIVWEKLDNKKSSKIKYEMPVELSNQLGKLENYDTWKEKISWFIESFDKFYKVICPYWEQVQKEL